MEQRTVDLHGQQVAWTELDGTGATLVLLHGVGSSSRTWDTVLPLLEGRGPRVLAVDLPGHGESSHGRGDYSLGAFASLVRDLLDHLDVERAVLVGHSLGGGISMQFAYQYPDRCAGLVLVASGGLGREASIVLRAATLPGSELVLSGITRERPLRAMTAVSRALARTPWPGPSGGLDDAVLALRRLQPPGVRRAFLASLRSVVDRSGQRVQAGLADFDGLPVLLVWGDRDAILPVSHAHEAARVLPSARLVVFPGATHEPHRFDPDRFADLLIAHVDDLAETMAVEAIE